MKDYDVVNHSWGSKERILLSSSKMKKRSDYCINGYRILSCGTNTRAQNGLGTVIVNSAGNERMQGGNANYST
ncbi:hypothetical protein INT80_11310 [Gallibacterium anatis]|uniref:Uncharacterized protein n=1 Tax=Gallibacterium anatis TaxID=750 RepID=A0A930UT85_9PAST|nr:hypothetical protein [Gallibacterium anatis]